MDTFDRKCNRRNEEVDPEETLIDVQEAARILAYKNPRSIYTMIYKGDIPSWMVHDLPGGRIRFRRSEIMMLAQRRHPMPSHADVKPETLYSLGALAHILRVTTEAIHSFVSRGLLKFIAAGDGSTQFLGKHVLEFLDKYGQAVIKPGPPLGRAGATARKAKDGDSADEKQESTTKDTKSTKQP